VKTILVTGGFGFIGSRLVEELSKTCKVIVLDNKDTYGTIDQGTKKKMYQTRTRRWKLERVSVVEGDIMNQRDCLKAFSYQPDVVVHLAAYPRAQIVDDNPVLGIPKLVTGTTNLLYNADKFDTKRFVYVSSSMVYGDFKDGVKEDADTKPTNLYGEAKLMGERLTKLFCKKNNMDYIIVRPSGVYGKYDLPDRVIPKFFAKAMQNKIITLHNGSNKVDFTFKNDIIRGLIKCALETHVKNQSFNITNGNAHSLRELADEVMLLTGSKSEVIDVGNHDMYPMRGTLDIFKAKALLKWEPETTFKEGLRKYYESITSS
jgi:nucleoside-diphosphate-sugar epimerase|tara:strand:+ start:296 stop:1246 length:951 start_codon:yes stop_codon:yes gene_type:complete